MSDPPSGSTPDPLVAAPAPTSPAVPEVPSELGSCDALLDALRQHPAIAPHLESPARVAAAQRVFGLSPFAARLCTARPEVLAELLDAGLLDDAEADSGTTAQLATGALYARVRRDTPADLTAPALGRALREIRAREMLRIAWRDLLGLASLDQTLRELSALADACVEAALRALHAQACAVHGAPLGPDGAPLQLVVLALGKLGGEELNFSSDIDLVCCYEHAGTTAGPKPLAHEEFFGRLTRRLTAMLDELTDHGRVFRVDLRLRPFGSSGPLAIDFDSTEHYYQQHGRDWERYALIKARPIAGDIAAGQRLLERLRPFVYRRYLDYGAIGALREMKAGIVAQVRRGGLEDDLKLGPGGIREVEFFGQAHQLIRGGREPALRARGIREVLALLTERGLLKSDEHAALASAYAFLRCAENRVQMQYDQQTQHLPDDTQDRLRLALAMGLADWGAFAATLTEHRRVVHAHFTSLLAGPGETAAASDDPESAPALATLGWPDPEVVQAQLRGLRESHAYRHATTTARGRLDTLLPKVLRGAVTGTQPEQVLQRVLALLEQVCRRSTYLALLDENPHALDQLLRLMGASRWIAQWLTTHPVLLDELLDPRTLYVPLTATEVRSQLDRALREAAGEDLERAMEVLREVHHASVLRIAATELVGGGNAPASLTVLAQVLLGEATHLALQALTARHGAPPGAFLVLGYGRLGSGEMSYTSDLDLVFLHNAADAAATTSGPSPIALETFYARLAQRTVHVLATNTPAGRMYEVDLRLRPSGQSGPLVTSMEAYASYQHAQAWIWEHQALVRARPVAGNGALAARFEALRTAVLARPRDPAALREAILAMRQRMRAAGDSPEPADGNALKHAPGGVVDLEFLVQYLVLAHAHRHRQLLGPRSTQGLLHTAGTCGVLSAAQAGALVAAHRELAATQRAYTLGSIAPGSVDEALAGHRRNVMRAWQRLLGRSV